MSLTRGAVAILAFFPVLAGCRDVPTATRTGPDSEPPALGQARGLVEITITGIDGARPAATARAFHGDAEGSRAQVGPSTLQGITRSAQVGRELSVLPGAGTIQLEPVSSASFTVGTRTGGGFRYVSATYRVRNADASMTPYGSPRNSLTFLAVATLSTEAGTAISQLNRFDGTPASAGLAAELLPTGAANFSSATGTLFAHAPDVLQIFEEEEIATITPPDGVTVLPYGFVVRNPVNIANRILAADPLDDQFDGLVTFAFKVPLQATASLDPFTVSAMFLAMDDNQLWVTQSLEEADATSAAAVLSRASSLGGALRSLLGTTVVGTPAELACAVRTAGTAETPSHFLVNDIHATSQTPAPLTEAASFMPRSTAFGATFCSRLTPVTASTFVVHGAQGGRRFVGQPYTGDGSKSLTSPVGTFFPGEEVEVVLSSGLHSVIGGVSAVPAVTRYRAATASAGMTFSQLSPFPVGALPYSMAHGDFNGDGHPDLVTANNQSDNISILLGDGLGAFAGAPGSPIAVGFLPTSVAVGDMNGDDKLDLAVALNGASSVGVLFGDGTGGFTEAPGSPLAAGTWPQTVVIADFNGDDKLDIANTNRYSDNVTVFLGDGAGAFDPAVGSPAGTEPHGLTVGEFNNDGVPAFAVTNPFSDAVTVLLGDGAGGFAEAGGSPLTVGDFPNAVVQGDVDGDSEIDLLTVNGNSGDLTVLIGDGAGNFTEAAGGPLAVGGSNLLLQDVNADGVLDLFVTTYPDLGDVTLLLGDGAGGFAGPGSTFAVGSFPVGIVVTDVNHDGLPDLATANQGGNDVSVLLADGAGGYVRGGEPFATGASPVSVAVGDVNGDGQLDVAAANQNSHDVTLMLGDGIGGFAPAPGSPLAAGDTPVSVVFGDLNGDGSLDLAVANVGGSNVTVLLGNGAGGFAESAGSPFAVGQFPYEVVLGDVNGDGSLDIVTANSASFDVSVLLGSGTGAFAPAPGSPVTLGVQPESVVLGDFNGDGSLDIAVASSGANNVTLLLGNGAGAFTAAAGGPFAVGDGPVAVAAGDVSGDGVLDLVTAHANTNDVTILLGTGSGGFVNGPGSPYLVGGGLPQDVVLGDVNGDGRLDIATVSFDDVTLLLGAGSGAFAVAPGGPLNVGAFPRAVALGDVNGDGTLDLTVANRVPNSVTVRRNR